MEYRQIEERDSKAKLGCFHRIEKFFVWIINFVLFVVGLAQIAAGAWAWKSDASDWTGTSLPKACIAMGIIVMFISFLGCCGAWKENRPMLWLYSFFIFVLVLGQVGALSVAGVSRDYTEKFMQEVWEHMDADTQDRVEMAYKCCSFEGSMTDIATQADQEDYTKCSEKHKDDAGKNGWDSPIESCYEKAKDDVNRNLKTVLIAVAIVGGVQIMILFMTMCLINGISAKTAVKKTEKRSEERAPYPNI